MKKDIMLIVDDIEVNRQLLEEYFEQDYTIIHAYDGVDAIAKIKEYATHIAMILLDIIMPNMNGIDVLKWMSDTPYKAIPVVAITTDPTYQLEAIENGAWDFIAKPTENTIIKARVNNVLGRYNYLGQRETMDMLRKARVEIDNLVNSIPGGIAIYKLSDQFETLYFSDGVAALSGHTREEYEAFINQVAEKIVYEGDRERLFASVGNALKNGQDADVNYRICHKNGSLVWVHLNATLISEDHGVPIIHAVFQSVSKQDRLYNLLVNKTQSAIYVSDINTYELLYLNETASRIIDTPDKDYGGKKCYEYIFGRTSPCPFCKIKEMGYGGFSERVFKHPINKNTYHLKGKLVNWCGINAHVEYILDVTEQYSTQLKLRETQNLLEAALQNTNITVWEYDIASKSITHSFNFKEVYGLEEQIGNFPESLIECKFVHPKSVEDFRALYDEVASGKEMTQRDILLQNTDRTGYRWARVIYKAVLEKDGRHLKSIGTSMDVTEQKYLEESFSEIESLRSEITNGIMVNVSKDVVDTVYSKMESIHELNDGNMTNFFQKSGLRILEEAQRAEYDTVFNRGNLLHAYAVGRTEQFVEALCQYNEDEARIVQLHIRLTKNPHTGDVIAYTYVVDVNEQRTLELIMDKVSLENFEFILLLDTKKDTARMISHPSPDAQAAPLDYPNYESGIVAFCDHFVLENQRNGCKEKMSIANIAKQLELQNKYVITPSVIHSNGEIRVKRLCYSYLHKAPGKVLITVEDITELVQTEQEKNRRLSEALDAAEKASASKSQFLSNMSHDMRTPMNAIIGFSQMALDTPASEKVMESYMEKINQSGHYLLNLINDVLDMAKIESNKISLKLEAVHAAELFGVIISAVKPMMDAKNIEFVFEIHGFREDKAAMIDKLRMQQIFVNILSNAAKFTPPHGKIECIIELLYFDGKYAKDRVTIRDTGCGMSEAFLGKVFLPFEQEHTIDDVGQDGTGLGLSIVKSLIELMGGSITINSTKGVGTEAILDFTTELVDSLKAKSAPANQPLDKITFDRKRILLCEDHLLNREIASKLLITKGFEIECANNGAEGLELFKHSSEHYYDAVLMDIRMPIMDGLQATAAIRQLDRADAKTVPIIAMTANAFADDIQKSFDCGMNAHLAKPIEPARLYATLHTLLSTREDM